MLQKGNKTFYILIFCAAIASCNNHNSKSATYVNNNFQKYSTIYATINDSIQRYTDSLLGTFQSAYIWPWQVDSMLCLNSKSDLLFTTILSSSGTGKGMTGDDAEELLGKKINGKWFFFKGGGTLIVPRDMYGKDEMHPLSFYELSQIARKNMMASALIRKGGEYIVDDDWVEDKFYNTGYGLNLSRAQYDSIHWMLIMRKWTEKIDTNEYKPLKKHTHQKTNS